MLSQAAVSCLWKAYLTHSLPTVCIIRCLPESAMVCLVRETQAPHRMAEIRYSLTKKDGGTQTWLRNSFTAGTDLMLPAGFTFHPEQQHMPQCSRW